MSKLITFAGKTHTGMVRKHNEDSFYIPKSDDPIVIAMVADGMGGYRGGDIASKMCVETITQYIFSKYSSNLVAKDVRAMLFDCIDVANTAIYDFAKVREFYYGMGTTLVMAVFIDDEIYIGNVGDSRAYISTKKSIKQLSVDNSLVQEYVNSGKITKSQARTHPQRNIVTRALGNERDVMLDTYKHKFKNNEILLLCSDGLYEHISDEEILKVLTKKASLDEMANTLIKIANTNGGSDNISVTLASKGRGDA